MSDQPTTSTERDASRLADLEQEVKRLHQESQAGSIDQALVQVRNLASMS